jgi:hypothetical protein
MVARTEPSIQSLKGTLLFKKSLMPHHAGNRFTQNSDSAALPVENNDITATQ